MPKTYEIPRNLEDVAEWADKIRGERLNATGRAWVDLVELVVRELIEARTGGLVGVERLAATADKLLRGALAADKGEVDRSIVELRKAQERREAMGSEFDAMH